MLAALGVVASLCVMGPPEVSVITEVKVLVPQPAIASATSVRLPPVLYGVTAHRLNGERPWFTTMKLTRPPQVGERIINSTCHRIS